MLRRIFLESLGGLGMMAAAADSVQDTAGNKKRSNYYLLQNYYLKNGSQMPRIHEFMSRGLMPALGALHVGPQVFLEALVAPHMPQFAAIVGLETFEQLAEMRAGLNRSESFRQALEKWEAAAEPPYEHFSQVLLKAADYSPELVAAQDRSAPARIFELRVYHSPTWRQLRALHERFQGPEIKIFHRSGVHPILYSETVVGPNMPNLTYVIPFESLAAREKAWAAFGADPEWAKVRQESVDRYGQISNVIQISLFRAAAYSPVL